MLEMIKEKLETDLDEVEQALRLFMSKKPVYIAN
jgi:hypothetical protein